MDRRVMLNCSRYFALGCVVILGLGFIVGSSAPPKQTIHLNAPQIDTDEARQ